MKNIVISIILILSLNTNINAQSSYKDYLNGDKQTFFIETFDDNSNNWCIGAKLDGKAKGSIADGNFQWHSMAAGTFPTCHVNVTIDEERDFEIETSIRYISGEDNNASGIYWGGNDYDLNYYYRFAFSGNGYFIISRYNGTWTQYKDWTESPLINKTDYNKLTIRKVSGKLYFFLNEAFVHSTPFERFYGNKIGFNTNQNTLIYVDYLRVAYLGKMQIPDNKGPEISIYEPTVSRGFKITDSGKQIMVKGKATDPIGIYEVNINGIEAILDESGNFEQIVKLATGENLIKVEAIDTRNNSSSFTFYVNRPSNALSNNVTVNDTPPANNEKRIALVIGNANYSGGQYLKNPTNDANLMATTLQALGFDIIKRLDANKQTIEQAIREFSKKLPDYNVALFYYAGHGLQVDGTNYLIPTDSKLEDKSDCKFEAVSVNYIVEEFEKYPDNTNIVILDACRNDPFRSWSRGGEQGFKAINPTSGTIIAFATSEGATASDGKDQNGLFTQELTKQMNIPQSIESVFKKTRVEVEKLSKNTQSPQEWTKLKGDFWFKK